MIELLTTLRAKARSGVLGERSARLLEWDRVVGQIARHCVNGRATTAVRGRRPVAEPLA